MIIILVLSIIICSNSYFQLSQNGMKTTTKRNYKNKALLFARNAPVKRNIVTLKSQKLGTNAMPRREVILMYTVLPLSNKNSFFECLGTSEGARYITFLKHSPISMLYKIALLRLLRFLDCFNCFDS